MINVVSFPRMPWLVNGFFELIRFSRFTRHFQLWVHVLQVPTKWFAIQFFAKLFARRDIAEVNAAGCALLLQKVILKKERFFFWLGVHHDSVIRCLQYIRPSRRWPFEGNYKALYQRRSLSRTVDVYGTHVRFESKALFPMNHRIATHEMIFPDFRRPRHSFCL